MSLLSELRVISPVEYLALNSGKEREGSVTSFSTLGFSEGTLSGELVSIGGMGSVGGITGIVVSIDKVDVGIMAD